MSHLDTWILATVFCVPLIACAHADPTSGGELMQAALSDAEGENGRHAEACAAAASLPVMMSELDRHGDSMDDLMQRMDGARTGMRTGMGMRHCTGGAFDHMSRTLDQLHDAMSGHDSRMRAVEVMDDARSECRNHTEAMAGTMRGMRDDLESMPCMGGAGE